MNGSLKKWLVGVAITFTMAAVYGTVDLVFTAYGAERTAEQNAEAIADQKEKLDAIQAEQKKQGESGARVDERTKAMLEALKDIQRRLPQ